MSEVSMNSTNWLIVIVGLGAAASAGLIGWVISQSVAEIPEEDRTYLDKLPMFFRALWWPTLWVAFHLGRFIPISARESLMVKLRLAGLDYVISPEQLLAHRVVVSVVGCLIGLWSTTFLAFLPVSTALMIGGGFGFIYSTSWFRDRVLKRKNDMLKTLPFFLDIITLCVEAGLNLTGAFQQAVLKGPEGPLKVEASRVLRDIRAGKPRVDALRAMAERMNDTAITSLVSAMIQAEQLGMNLGPIMRAQADQRRTERFVRAEKAAMEAPVKMLFPLIAFIFPCTFLVLGFPILMKFMQMGF
jgi:tight adherence protein C